MFQKKFTPKPIKIPEPRNIEYELDWAELDELAPMPSNVITNEQMAALLGFSKDTLENRVTEKYGMTLSAYRGILRAGFGLNVIKAQTKSGFDFLNHNSLKILGQQFAGQSDKQDSTVKGSVMFGYTPKKPV